MVDIQSPTADIRRGKKKNKGRKKKKETTGQKYNGLLCYIARFRFITKTRYINPLLLYGGHNKAVAPSLSSKLDSDVDTRYDISQPVAGHVGLAAAIADVHST